MRPVGGPCYPEQRWTGPGRCRMDGRDGSAGVPLRARRWSHDRRMVQPRTGTLPLTPFWNVNHAFSGRWTVSIGPPSGYSTCLIAAPIAVGREGLILLGYRATWRWPDRQGKAVGGGLPGFGSGRAIERAVLGEWNHAHHGHRLGVRGSGDRRVRRRLGERCRRRGRRSVPVGRPARRTPAVPRARSRCPCRGDHRQRPAALHERPGVRRRRRRHRRGRRRYPRREWWLADRDDPSLPRPDRPGDDRQRHPRRALHAAAGCHRAGRRARRRPSRRRGSGSHRRDAQPGVAVESRHCASCIGRRPRRSS
jgi:hypothetical protein